MGRDTTATDTAAQALELAQEAVAQFMTAHEEPLCHGLDQTDNEALANELHTLVRAWREAGEDFLGAIADANRYYPKPF